MSELLLQTKFFKPTLRPALIERLPLVERLNDGLGAEPAGFASRLTLVSAPAGFGKTTLVTAWIAQLAQYRPQLSAEQVAWLSLDENDNDPVRFLTYLTSALQAVVPQLGETALRFLRSPQPTTAEAILTLLINDLSQSERPLILVLDDYHVIDAAPVHTALTYLIDHQPAQLHLMITTRSDPPLPLSRLRVRGQMTEIRADDLRFGYEETGLFLNQIMGLTLTQDELVALEERTEGWVAGLQLAALSLRGRANQAELITAFAGSHRFIVDYLTEEVISHQSESVRNFLLATSVLERICGPLGDALTQADAGQGQEILEYLEQSNLFLIPLDEERRWFRYHHLFAEVLLQRLRQSQTGRLPTLHQLASQWLAQNGLLDEAIDQALAAGDFEEAAGLIERVHSIKWQTGEINLLQDWLAELPATAWQAHPRLWLVQAWGAMTIGDFATGDEKLRGAEAALAVLDETTTAELRPEVLAFRACYASLMNTPNAVELSLEALRLLPDSFWLRGILIVFLGSFYYAQGDLDSASEVLAGAHIPPGADPATRPHNVHLLALDGMVQLEKGRAREADRLVHQALDIAEPGGKPVPYVGTLFAYMAASLVGYELDQLEQMESVLSRCLDMAVGFGSVEVQVFALSILLQIRLAYDDLPGAASYAGQADVLLRNHDVTSRITAYVYYNQFQLLIRQGHLDAAVDWLAIHSREDASLNPYSLYRLALPRLLMAQGDPQAALRSLEPLIEAATETGHGNILIKGLVLQAAALLAHGSENQALSTLAVALDLGERAGFVRSFVDEGEPIRRLLIDYRAQLGQGNDPLAGENLRRRLAYVNKLLAAFPVLGPPPSQWPMDMLSERELEVLRLVAAGASNRDIADRLFVAVPTVKKHISNIMSKLDANSRTQAVAEARAQGIL